MGGLNGPRDMPQNQKCKECTGRNMHRQAGQHLALVFPMASSSGRQNNCASFARQVGGWGSAAIRKDGSKSRHSSRASQHAKSCSESDTEAALIAYSIRRRSLDFPGGCVVYPNDNTYNAYNANHNTAPRVTATQCKKTEQN